MERDFKSFATRQRNIFFDMVHIYVVIDLEVEFVYLTNLFSTRYYLIRK